MNQFISKVIQGEVWNFIDKRQNRTVIIVIASLICSVAFTLLGSIMFFINNGESGVSILQNLNNFVFSFILIFIICFVVCMLEDIE